MSRGPYLFSELKDLGPLNVSLGTAGALFTESIP